MNRANDIPTIDLSTFFLSISSAAFMGMGIAPPGYSESLEIDFDLVRQNIDLLELLKEKTEGNRTQDEDQLLDRLLFETRMKFVEKQKELEGKNG